MATDFTRLAALVQAYANLVAAQNNLRGNLLIIQTAQQKGTLTVSVAKAMQDLGTAFAQRIALVQTVLNTNDPGALGVAANDIAALLTLLTTQATALVASTPITPADVATIIATVNAAVPATVSPFVSTVTPVPDVPVV